MADLTWFNHPGEVLLYYLVHLAKWRGDVVLTRELADLGVPEFLDQIRVIDQTAGASFAELAARPEYVKAFSEVDPKLASLAIGKAFLTKLGLTSFRSLSIAQELPLGGGKL